LWLGEASFLVLFVKQIMPGLQVSLDAGEGRSIRIPNHLLLAEVVTIYGEGEQPTTE
jgi:hypothetical protein